MCQGEPRTGATPEAPTSLGCYDDGRWGVVAVIAAGSRVTCRRRSALCLKISSKFLEAWLVFLKNLALVGCSPGECLLQLTKAIFNFLVITTWFGRLRLQSVGICETQRRILNIFVKI